MQQTHALGSSVGTELVRELGERVVDALAAAGHELGHDVWVWVGGTKRRSEGGEETRSRRLLDSRWSVTGGSGLSSHGLV